MRTITGAPTALAQVVLALTGRALVWCFSARLRSSVFFLIGSFTAFGRVRHLYPR